MRRSNKLTLNIKAILIFFAVSFLFSSCKKEEMDNSIGTSGGNSIPVTGKASVKVNVLGEAFETVGGAAAPGASGTSVNAATMNIKDGVQHQVIPFNKDFDLVADLIPVSSNVNNTVQSSAKGDAMPTTVQTPLGAGIKYKVVVFESSTGNYVTERNYVRGSEQITDSLNLNGGSKYTFVAYSIGSATALPDIIFADTTAKNLNNSSISVTSPTKVMYYKIDLQLTGGQTNYLNIVLTNQTCEITTKIDASAMGVISAIGSASMVSGPLNVSQIKLQDLSFFKSVRAGFTSIQEFVQGVNVVFPTVGTTVVTSTPTELLLAYNFSGDFNMNMTINGISKSITVHNVLMTKGVKYNLNLKFTQTGIVSPTDATGTVQEGWDVGPDVNQTYTWK